MAKDSLVKNFVIFTIVGIVVSIATPIIKKRFGL